MTTEDLEQSLINYISVSSVAQTILSQLRAYVITLFDIQRALCDVLKIDSMYPGQLLERTLTVQLAFE